MARSTPVQAAMAGRRYEFCGLRFDPVRGLEREGQWVPLAPLERRALGALLAAAGGVVSKDALALAVWFHRAVSDESVTRVVYRLRQALRSAGAPGALVTVYRSGFRIAVPVAAVELEPGAAHLAALENAATARELLGGRGPRDLAAATVAARRAVRLAPQRADTWLLLARISLLRVLRGRIGREVGLRRVRVAATRAHALAPESGGGLAVLAWLDAVHGDDLAALALLSEAVARNPHDAVSHCLRAWALLAAGRREEALSAFGNAQALDPLSRTWTAMYGYSLACCGHDAVAFALLNNAIRRMPDTDILLAARSSVAAIAGDADLAVADARRAIALAPDVAANRVALACALAARGEVRAARRTFAAVSHTRFGVAPAAVALVLSTLGDEAEAARAWAEAHAARCIERGLVRHDPRLRESAPGPSAGPPREELRRARDERRPIAARGESARSGGDEDSTDRSAVRDQGHPDHPPWQRCAVPATGPLPGAARVLLDASCSQEADA